MIKKRTVATTPGKKKTTLPRQASKDDNVVSKDLGDDDVHSHGDQRPLDLDMSLIDEDPHQPRTEFNQELLQEMAKTIRSRGVKNPISVHKHPTEKGRYVINDGARRYRASTIAGRKTIKAFVDSDFTKIDQIIVNAHHETFTSREWAVLIDQEEKKGKKKSEIADELGKSRAFITHHTKLLSLPDSIAEVFSSARCTDATALNDLVVMWNRDREEVETWLQDENREISRGTVRQLRSFLDIKPPQPKGSEEEKTEDTESAGKFVKKKLSKQAGKNKKGKVIVLVLHEDKKARLIVNRPLSDSGLAWFIYEENGVEFESALDQVKLVALVEG
ncbi:MAG: ParB/RepB/Spo0J family partition protein [Nitrosospira sp.]